MILWCLTKPMLSWKSVGGNRTFNSSSTSWTMGGRAMFPERIWWLYKLLMLPICRRTTYRWAVFPGLSEPRVRKVPAILKRWDQVKFEKVVGIGTPTKKKIEPFDGLLLFRTFSRLALYQLFAFNVVKAAKVEKTKSASNHLRGSALTTFCQSYNFDVKIDLDTLFVKGHKRSSKTCKGHTMQIHEMYSRIPAALVWWIVIADSLTNCRSWWKTWIRMAIASVLQRSCLPFNWWQYLPDKSWPNKYAWNMKTIVY